MQKSGQKEPESFSEKISRNMTDTEKMMMTNIIGNFVVFWDGSASSLS